MHASASVNRSGGVATVVVVGEVDAVSTPIVDEAIREAIIAEGVDTVLVDLAAVRFLDSSGIALLLKWRRLADEGVVVYRVTGAEDTVRLVLELSGVWEHLSGDSSRPAQT